MHRKLGSIVRQEYRAVDKSRGSHPVLLECDVMRLRGSVYLAVT
jgi:hypothetical protein